MTPSRHRPTPHDFCLGLLMLCCVGLLGGCNLFGTGSLDEGTSVDELVADADVAMSKGKYDSAVQSLEKAYDKAPQNPEVRIKLSTALYGQADLTVVDLKRLVDYVSNLEDESAKHLSTSKNGLQCSIDAAEPNPTEAGYTEVDLQDKKTFAQFTSQSSAETITRVWSQILDQGFVATEAYDNLPPDLKASWLTNAAFTNIARAILTVYDAAETRNGRLFRDSENKVVFCAETQADLDTLECEAYRTAEQENLIGEQSLLDTALNFLRQKNEAYGSAENSGVLPDSLQRLIDAVLSNIDDETRKACTASKSLTAR